MQMMRHTNTQDKNTLFVELCKKKCPNVRMCVSCLRSRDAWLHVRKRF